MLARCTFAAFTTALLVVPVAAETPTSTTARSKEQVKIEVRFVTIAEDFFDRIGVNFHIKCNGENMALVGELDKPSEPIFLDDKQLHKFLESLQGDVRTNFVDAIKTVVSDGKTAVWRRTRQHSSGTSPIESISTGYKVAIQPTVVAGRGVALKMKLSLTCLDAEKPLRTTTLSLRDELTIPAGHTVLLGGWKRLSEGRVEYGPPVTRGETASGDRPVPKASYKRSTENVLILVTATIVEQENK
jgi:hypothetical protein